MTYYFRLQTILYKFTPPINWALFFTLFIVPAIYSQNFNSQSQGPGAETVFTYPISGEIYDAFSQRPISGATARFIILPDSTNFQTDHLGHFNGKWESIEEDIVQNYPNPFNPSTTIQFASGYDILEIYTILGQLLTRVDVNNQDQIDIEMASGVYVYRLRDNQTGKVAQNKMIALDGGFFTIYLEQVDRSSYGSTNMFNKSNTNFDDFAEVKIIRAGYAVLDTNVRLIEGVRNEFEFTIKPKVTFKLSGTIRNNYGSTIKSNRLLLIHHPLNEPDTLYNGVVGYSYNCGTFVRVAKQLDDVMIKLIRYGYETHIEYITLYPGGNVKHIELHKPLNDYLLTGLIIDGLTGKRLNKKLVIHRRNSIQDTISSDNGLYQTTLSDTALSMVVNLEVLSDIDHAGSSEKFTIYARKPFMTEHQLKPVRFQYTANGLITVRGSNEPVTNTKIFIIHQEDTLASTFSNHEGIYNTLPFFFKKPKIFSARIEILPDKYDRRVEYVEMNYGENTKNLTIKP